MRAKKTDPPTVLQTSRDYSHTTKHHKSIGRSALTEGMRARSFDVDLDRMRHHGPGPIDFLRWVLEKTRAIDDARKELFKGSLDNVKYRAARIAGMCKSLTDFMHMFRGELDIRKYADTDTPHEGTIIVRSDSPSCGRNDGSPRSWIAYAKELIRSSPAGFPTIGDRAHLARKLDKKQRDARAELTKWIAGEGGISSSRFHVLGRDSYARVCPWNPEEVETSRGARVPKEHAVRLARFILSGRGENVVGARIGHFTVKGFDPATYRLRIGCYEFGGDEVRRICAILAGNGKGE